MLNWGLKGGAGFPVAFFAAIFWLFSATAALSDPADNTALTEAEKRYVAQNPTFSVAATPDWPPFEFQGKGGGYEGITADFHSSCRLKSRPDAQARLGRMGFFAGRVAE